MIDFSTVIFSLIPDAEFSYFGNKIVAWEDTRPQPTKEEIQARLTELEDAEPMRLLREQRGELLSKTDWRMVEDYPMSNKLAWKNYRQELRDLPSKSSPSIKENGQLSNVTWPTSPENE